MENRNRITEFKDKYRFLSNFWSAKVEFEFQSNMFVYPTVEHAYQSAKCKFLSDVLVIRKIESPGAAKKYARKIVLRDDWEEVKLGIMEDLVRQKFSEEELKLKLLDTGFKELIEGNYWHDNFWGSCFCERCGNQGKNNLGKIIMKIRKELQK
jgi:ribA/ribD-fused uncharacterized protein